MSERISLDYLIEHTKFHSSNGKRNKYNIIHNENAKRSIDFPYLDTYVSSNIYSPSSCKAKDIPFLILVYVKCGNGKLTVNSHDYELAQNSLLILYPNTEFNLQTISTPFSLDAYFFDGQMLNYMLSRIISETRDKDNIFLRHDCSKYISQTIDNIKFILEDQKPNSDILIFKCFTDIISDFTFYEQIKLDYANLPKHVKKLKYLLDQEYDQPHSLDSLEERIGINKYRLCHDFSDSMNISPIQYLNNVRIEQAKKLLEETELTVHEIGERVGIDNATHFINLFKKNCGMTPLQYRNNRTHSFIQT